MELIVAGKKDIVTKKFAINKEHYLVPKYEINKAKKSKLFRGLLLALTCWLWVVSNAQSPTASTNADIYEQLKKLKVLGSVLYVAAHPDDENNGFLPWLAKEKHYRTAYLSLTRGDGGQNLIGSEQGVELGMIRTQELLAARKIDGSEQYFSRAFEFGFCKNASEALRIWGKEKILSDVVWLIRQYQPDIIITRFPGDARAGHGHHAASSLLANEAFTAAADSTKFPEQFQYGVKPWQAKRILWNTFSFGSINTTAEDQFKVEVGGFNPALGKSYGEIGGEARSMHKSQGEGRPRRRGEFFEYFKTTGGTAPTKELLDGVNTQWSRLNGGDAIASAIDNIISQFSFEHPSLSVPALVQLYSAVKALIPSVWRTKKLQEIQDIIESCSGLFSEAFTAQQFVPQGDSLKFNCFVNQRCAANIRLVGIRTKGWDTSFNISPKINQNLSFPHTIVVANNEKISQPYWLEQPLDGGSFHVADQRLIGKAENDPAFVVQFKVQIEGTNFIIERPINYKTVDPARGEIYQPLVIIPKVELNYTKENVVAMNGAKVPVGIHFKSNVQDSNRYHIQQRFSPQWSFSPNELNIPAFDHTENTWEGYFTPKTKGIDSSEVAHLWTDKGDYNGYTKSIQYDHIPTITYFPKAKTNLVQLSVKTVGKKIGYLIGAGDKIPDALTQMGYEVTMLKEADLQPQVLKQFDAIITGIRAYNLNEYLTTKHDMLMNYVKNGGNLIVQYAKSNQVGSKPIKMGPYPFVVNSLSRVTEEDATVHFLLPNHPLLNFPNKITPKDFEGWTQERSTYQAEQVDSHYEALLGMKDSGDKQESNGSLITTKYGKGRFSYVSLVLFRQLPAGVPGAYRLLANLIAK